MPGIEKELITFVVAVISGASARLIYRCLECIRNIFKHSLLITGMEDVLYWIGIAIYFFVQIYQTSNGSIRWYFVLGVVVGVVFTTIFLRKMKKVEEKFVHKIKRKNLAEPEKKG